MSYRHANSMCSVKHIRQCLHDDMYMAPCINTLFKILTSETGFPAQTDLQKHDEETPKQNLNSEYPAKSYGISYGILWNILWSILWNPVEYLMEYPMECPVEPCGISYEILWNILWNMLWESYEYPMNSYGISYGIPYGILWSIPWNILWNILWNPME